MKINYSEVAYSLNVYYKNIRNTEVCEYVENELKRLNYNIYDRLIESIVFLEKQEHYILKNALDMIEKNIEEYFGKNFFPIWIFEDNLISGEFNDIYSIKNLTSSHNIKNIGKGIEMSCFNGAKIDAYSLFTINNGINFLSIYNILYENNKYEYIIERYLKYLNRSYLYKLLTSIRKEYSLTSDISKELAILVIDNIDNFSIPMSSNNEATKISNIIYKFLIDNSINKKYNSKPETTFTSNNDASNDSSLPVVLPSKEEIKNIYEKENEKGEEEMEKIIDTIETVGKDGKILYTADINDKEEVKDIAEYILNQDASHIYSRDTNTGKKGINFFDYSELKDFYISTVKNKSAYKYKIVSDALLNMIKSDAVKVLVLDYEKNPFFHVSLKRIKDLDEGIIWIYTTSKDCLIKAIYDSQAKTYSYKLFVGLTLSEKDEL